MAKVSFTRQAREDLIAIWLNVAVHDAAAADRIYDQIERACRLLCEHPQLGPARPEIAEGARVLVIERWLAFYREVAGGVQIVRVIDGVRDLTRLDWLSDSPSDDTSS